MKDVANLRLMHHRRLWSFAMTCYPADSMAASPSAGGSGALSVAAGQASVVVFGSSRSPRKSYLCRSSRYRTPGAAMAAGTVTARCTGRCSAALGPIHRGRSTVGRPVTARRLQSFTWLLAVPPDAAGQLGSDTVHWWFVLLHIFAGWFAYAFPALRSTPRQAGSAAPCSLRRQVLWGPPTGPRSQRSAIWLPRSSCSISRSLRGSRPLPDPSRRRISSSFADCADIMPCPFCRPGCRGSGGAAVVRRELVWYAAAAPAPASCLWSPDAAPRFSSCPWWNTAHYLGPMGELRQSDGLAIDRCRTPYTRAWAGVPRS